MRGMRWADLAAVAGIEEETLSPWSELSLAGECSADNRLLLVAEEGIVGVVAWCSCRLIWPEAELLKISVAAEKRRSGVGCFLFKMLVGKLRQGGFETLFLEVRATNEAALKFYEKNGCTRVGFRDDYYSNPPDRAIILKKKMG